MIQYYHVFFQGVGYFLIQYKCFLIAKIHCYNSFDDFELVKIWIHLVGPIRPMFLLGNLQIEVDASGVISNAVFKTFG